MNRSIVGLVLIASFLAAGCGGSSESQPMEPPPPVPPAKTKDGKDKKAAENPNPA